MSMPRVLATSTAFPAHYYSQESITAELQRIWAPLGLDGGVVERLHRATSVEGRHVAVAMEEYYDLNGWEEPNAIFTAQALEIGQQAIESVMAEVPLKVQDVSLLIFASTTGLSVPTIDARLMNRLPFRRDVKRVPIYGLGCAAGAAGVARMADYLRGHPREAGLLLCVEFCSLSIQKNETSIANVIACGLFGDGAAAVLMVGDEHPLAQRAAPEVIDSRSVFFPDSEDYMGWRVREAGMELLLSAEVPAAAGSLREPLAEFLGEHGLAIESIVHWVCHPGGPKVIDALETSLGLNGTSLAASRDALRRIGNVSSVSVLVLLDQFVRRSDVQAGSYGVMTAMGPGFAAELVLLRW